MNTNIIINEMQKITVCMLYSKIIYIYIGMKIAMTKFVSRAALKFKGNF